MSISYRKGDIMFQKKEIKKVLHVLIFSKPKPKDSVREASVPRYPNGKVTG